MNRFSRAACLLLPVVLAGCGAWPNETRITSRNWAHPKVNQNAGPSYCYKTLADVQCTAKPLPEPAAGRLEGAYSTDKGPTVNGAPPPGIFGQKRPKKGWFAQGYAANSKAIENRNGSGGAMAARRPTTADDWKFLDMNTASGGASGSGGSSTAGGTGGGVDFTKEPPKPAPKPAQ